MSKVTSSRFAPLLVLVAAAFGWIVLRRTFVTDANFVAYRFAANLIAGRGLVYWTPAPAVSTYPLVPYILALAGYPGFQIPMLGGLISAVAASIGMIFTVRLSADRPLAGFAYILAIAAQPSPVVLTMLALALAGIDAARCQRWTWAGLLIGFAILAEPSAIVPAVLLLMFAVATGGSVLRYLLPAAALLFFGLTFSVSPLNVVAVTPGVITFAILIIAILALVRHFSILRQLPHVAILLAWSAITALSALLGGSLPTAAILPGLIALAAMAHPQVLVVAAACTDLILGLLLSGPSLATADAQAAGQWIAANTGPQALVATTDSGALAFYAERPIVDLSRKIQPVDFDSTFFLRYAPDVVALKAGTPVPWEGFKTTYAQVYAAGEQTVYQRVVNFAPLDDHGVDVNFSAQLGRADLHLSNVAVGSVLHPGDFVRVQLDWELAYQPSFDVEIKLTLLNEQGQPVAGMPVGKVPPDQWHVGKVSTYHLIVLPNDAPAGSLSLYLGVGIRAGSLGELKVAEVSVAR